MDWIPISCWSGTMERFGVMFALFLGTLSVTICAVSGYKRVCYFTGWARYRAGAASYNVANVDPFLCTHIIYAFAEFDSQGNMTPFQDTQSEIDVAFNNLKSHNPDLKTMLAVGGWTFDSKRFSQMTGDHATRSTFVTSAVRFLRQHGFDGLDLDWEYPGMRGGAAKDRDSLVALCKDLRQAFEAEAIGTKRLLLSAAVPADRANMDVGYNIQALDRYVDLWNLMTYDYHGSWAGTAGHNSPLFASSRDSWDGAKNNVQWTASEYVRRGASKEKVMIGLPMYGRSYSLSNPSYNTPLSSASLGPAGPITREAGFWAYFEVCRSIAESGSSFVTTDAEQRVPYYVNKDLWISFDDVNSIREKTRWVKQNGFGGFMAWTIDMDVFNPSLCPTVSSPYPLLSAAKAVLLDAPESGASFAVATTTAPAPTTTRLPVWLTTRFPGVPSTTQGPLINSGTTEFICGDRPYRGYRDPSSPCRFIVCWAGQAHHMTCLQGTVFDEAAGVCVWPPGNTNVYC